MTSRYVFLVVGVFLLAFPIQAQQAASLPASFNAAEAAALDDVALVTMPTVDNDALVARDEARSDGKLGPLRFAEPFDVATSTRNAGTWETLGDGSRLWRLRIASPGAYSLNLGFDQFRLPEGATLWIYPAGEEPHFRAFTSADNEAHGELWTPIVRGDEVVVELNLPEAKPSEASDYELRLARVNHAYRPFGIARSTWNDTDLARSGSCNVDVVCPEGNPYRDIIRSVGAYTRSGTDICSGSAMNNTSVDGTPYFLTADHCGNSAGNAPSVVIYWNYENSTCRPPGSPASGGPGDGTRDQFSSGTIFHGTSGGGTSGGPDWTILEPDDPIPPEYSVWLNGWDRRDQATSSAIAIHHPQVEEKRISFENDPTSITSYLSATPNPNGTHVRVEDWDLGTTEGGSSGSPLYSPEKRVIGQLSGGFASCSSQTADWYGRMARNMTTGAEAFLDPGNTGALFIDGTEAGNPPGPVQLLAVMSAQPISVVPGETTTITVEVFNGGTETGEAVTFENVLPSALSFAGNLTASSGDASESDGTIMWTMDVDGGGSETISYDVMVSEDAPGEPITNEGLVEHPSLNLPLRPSTIIDVFIAPDFFYSNETGFGINDDGCPTFQSSTVDVTDDFEPISMKVGVTIQHTYRGDLRIQLQSPEGTIVNLLDRPGTGGFGTSADNLDALFSDTGQDGVFGTSGDHDIGAPFYDVEGQSEQGEQGTAGADPLSDFDGEDLQGTWTLNVCDGAGQDVGNVVQWALFFYTNNSSTDCPSEGILYADASSSGVNGTSWVDAFANLRDAFLRLNACPGVSEIRVAEGTYLPTNDGDRTISFEIPADIEVYGGFPTGGGTFSERDPVQYLTVLSGDLSGDDTGQHTLDFLQWSAHHAAPRTESLSRALGGKSRTGDEASLPSLFAGAEENSFHVVVFDGTAIPVTPATVLDGFVITGGNADGPTNTPQAAGGGLYCDGTGSVCSPTLRNLVFDGNSAKVGGGLYTVSADGGTSNLSLTRITFRNNAVFFGGGGAFLNATGGVSSPVFTNAVFEDNLAQLQGGGAVYANGFSGGEASPMFANVQFADNTAAENGGAVYANGEGGQALPVFTNVTFANNTVASGGGAAHAEGNPGDVVGLTFDNTVLWGNSNLGGPSTVSFNEATVTFRHSLVEGGLPVGATDGGGNLSSDPLFADESNGDFTLDPASPAIDAGEELLLPADTFDLDGDGDTAEPLPLDLDGDDRVQGSNVDMGAYEAEAMGLIVRAEPQMPPIVVGSSGGTFRYTVTLTNATGATKVFQAWVDAVLPDGNPFGPVKGPRSLVLTAGQTVGPVTLQASVPRAAPPGLYTVVVRAGAFPDVVEADDSFTFEKTGAAREEEMTPEDWPTVEVTDGEPVLADASIPMTDTVAASTALPTEFALAQAYPNPFDRSTILGFALPESTDLRLVVYDVLGREVVVLAEGPWDAGRHEVVLEGSRLAGGVYLVRLVAGEQTQAQRITLLR